MKMRPVGAQLFHAGGRADGQTDRQDEAIWHSRINTIDSATFNN